MNNVNIQPDRPYDLLTCGESMLRFAAPMPNLLSDSPILEVAIAGAESNVAVGVARMGYQSRWISRLTDNVLGRRMTHELNAYGVDCSGVVWTKGDRVGTYFLEFGAQPRPTQVIYDRAHSAASKMGPDTFDLAQVAQTKILHLTGITAALTDSCYALIVALLDRAREHGVHVILDVNYRALLWSAENCAAKLSPLMDRVTTLIVGRSDAATVFGLKGEPAEILNALQQKFDLKQVAITLAEQGAASLENGLLHLVPGYPVQMVDRIGAGDAFAAGVICGLLEGGDFLLGMRYGVAMSALQLSLKGDIFRLGRAEVLRLMESGIATRPVR